MHEVALLQMLKIEKAVPVLPRGNHGEISCSSFNTKNLERIFSPKINYELI
jgi:hypothetical protein